MIDIIIQNQIDIIILTCTYTRSRMAALGDRGDQVSEGQAILRSVDEVGDRSCVPNLRHPGELRTSRWAAPSQRRGASGSSKDLPRRCPSVQASDVAEVPEPSTDAGRQT